MKRITKILSVFAICFLALISLASCGSNEKDKNEKDKNAITFESNIVTVVENKATKDTVKVQLDLLVAQLELEKLAINTNAELKEDEKTSMIEAIDSKIAQLKIAFGENVEKAEDKYNSYLALDSLNQNLIILHVLDGKKAADCKNIFGVYNNATGALYLNGSTIPALKDGKEIEYRLVEKKSGLPKVEKSDKNLFGDYFAGWYQTEGLRNDGNRLITYNDVAKDADHIIYAYYMDIVEALLVALVCIIIVFGMLALLWGLVTLLKFVAPKQKEQAKPVEVAAVKSAPVKKAISLEDIKDEEMMAAALVATIDYHEETKEDVRVVSIKEIK